MSSREFNCPLCVSPRLSSPRGYFPPAINKSKESQWKTLRWATQCQLAATTMEDQSKLAPPTGCCLSGHQWVCTVAQGEKLSKCREEHVYSTLLNSTLLSTWRVERCLMDDPDFSGSSPKAGIRWRAVQNQPEGLAGETSADWTVISSFAAQMDNNRHLYCYHHKLIFCRLK